jgi:oligosaccharide repeat unit polymerase
MYELLLLANLMLWLSICAYFSRLPIASVFHPISYYLFFHGFIFTFRPIMARLGDYDFVYKVYQFQPSIEDKITVILAAMLGLVCFVAAALRTGTAPLRFAQDRCNDAERTQLIKPFLFVAALLVPLGVISILENWTTSANDASTMVFDAATGFTINTSGTGYFTDLQLLLAPMSVMLIWLLRFRWWSFVPLAIFIILRGGTGGRWPILMACGTVALMFLYNSRKRFPNIKAVAVVAAALMLFQVIGSDRGASIRGQFIEDNSFESVRTDRVDLGLLESMDFANLEYFEYIVYVVPQRSETYGYFLDNLQVFTEPVPRKFWADKPVGAPIKLFSLFDYGFPIGMTYSLPGEGWMQLGYLGVAFWCGLFGLLYGWIYNKFQTSDQSTMAVLTFLLVMPMSLQFFRDGLLLTLVKTHAWFLLPVGMVYGFARLAGVPLADEIRLMAHRRAARRRPDIAAKIMARQREGKRSIIGRTGWRAE